MIACTSDKSTLHIFDVPHPRRPNRASQQLPGQQQGGPSGGSSAKPDAGQPNGKWGILSKIPMMPRVFSDVYSFASAPFAASDDGDDAEPDSTGAVGVARGPAAAGKGLPLPADGNATLGTAARPLKGVIGWVGENALLVVGAGRDARWERFVVHETEDGRRLCFREGWRRYLTGI
jgi:hypothetical protein